MKNLMTAAMVALCAMTIFAEAASPVQQTPAKPDEQLTPEEKAEKKAKLKKMFRRYTEKKTGGKVRKANSAKGVFVILNAQKAVSDSGLQPILATIDEWLYAQASIKTVRPGVTLSVANVKDEIKAAGGVLGVALVDADGLPAFLAAPEDGWVIVNVKPLAQNATPEVLASRVRKEALRAYAFVTGGIYMSRSPILMRDVGAPSDLDQISRETFAFDVLSRMNGSSSFYGLTPFHETTYRKACTEGWAPAPTNDFQKAIWDEIHAMPTAPMKILPESQKKK